MKVSNNAEKLKVMIEKAIEDHKITRSEYDAIIHLATKDGYTDAQEKALLKELEGMIEDKSVKLTP
jgi:hypothetical protein